MSIATNLILILLGVNLMVAVFGNPENASPLIAVAKAIFLTASGGSAATAAWTNVLVSLSHNAGIYVLLIGAVTAVAYLTGANPLTGGGGYGSVMTLQIMAIGVFSSLLLMPNFATFMLPTAIEGILDVIFGGWIAVTVVTVLKGL